MHPRRHPKWGGAAENTIQRLTRDLGNAVLEYHDAAVQNVRAKRVQCDEVWCFCYAKDKNLPDEMRGEPGLGSIWTWTALDADSNLMVAWRLGPRPGCGQCPHAFIRDVQERHWRHASATQSVG